MTRLLILFSLFLGFSISTFADPTARGRYSDISDNYSGPSTFILILAGVILLILIVGFLAVYISSIWKKYENNIFNIIGFGVIIIITIIFLNVGDSNHTSISSQNSYTNYSNYNENQPNDNSFSINDTYVNNFEKEGEVTNINTEISFNNFEWLSNHLLTETDISDKTMEELRIMRNAIFARHGYKFNSPDLLEYFESFIWYEPKYSDVSNSLSSIEKENVAFIQKYEKRRIESSPSTLLNIPNIQQEILIEDFSRIISNIRLSDTDVAKLNKSQLRLLRNTIYARHGRKFKSTDLQEYFQQFPWYHGIYEEILSEDLSDIEKHNITIIQKYE